MNVQSSRLTIPTAKVFEPFLQPSRYKAAYGGRGGAKSHFFGEKLIDDSLEGGMRSVCIREVQKDLKHSSKQLIEDKIEALGMGNRHGFRVYKDVIETPKYGIVLFQGMQDYTAESIKSLEKFRRAWVEEAQTLSARSLSMLRPTIREPGSELWFSWNPRHQSDPVDQRFRGLVSPKNSFIKRVNYSDNPFFPPELEEERQYDRANAPDRYAHVWLGEYEPQAVGAIWTRQGLHDNRVAEAPDLGRILVAVDPAISAEDGANEHGIVVVGRGSDNNGYVLDDLTTTGTPQKWATRAIAAYDRWDADAIVIERNQGGDMCRHTLNTVRPGIRIIDVVATRGKHVRAEPISSLYGLDRIHHVGSFPELEAQQCLMTAAGYEGEGSPDRVDALVWGFTELFPAIISRKRTRLRPMADISTSLDF